MAWLAKSISGWGQTPKSTVTPVHSAMATPPSTGTGAAGGVPRLVVGLLVGQQDLLVERGHGARHRPPVWPIRELPPRRPGPSAAASIVPPPTMPPPAPSAAEPRVPPSASPSPPLAYISTATRR